MNVPEWFIKSRLMQAEIQSYDPVKGTVTVADIGGSGIEPINGLELCYPGFSASYTKSFRSSWIRYAPQVGDIVLVAFDNKSEPRIVAHAPYQSLISKVGATAQIQEANNNAETRKRFPYGDFCVLQPGEWDMRSSGGAYVKGSNAGELLLSGGPTVTLRFNKSNNDARTEGGLWVINSQGSQIRLGDVKRVIPTLDPSSLFVEQDMSVLDVTAGKEFWVRMTSPNASGVPALISDFQMGAVRDPLLGSPVISPTGAIARKRSVVYQTGSTAAAPIPVHTENVDLLGSKYTEYGPSASLDLVVAPATSFVATHLSTTLNTGAQTVNSTGAITQSASGAISQTAGGAMTLTAAAIQATAATINLGAAPSPAVLFTPFAAAMAALCTAAASSFGALAGTALPDDRAAYVALASAFSTLAGALATMPTVVVKVE